MATTLAFDIVARDRASRVFGNVGQESRRFSKTLGVLGAVGRTALAGAAVAATGLGFALTKGFQRLTNIEDATAKLQGLGHSAASVQRIMTNALDAVRGTAFGLDEAATLAATAVAAGVKPGADLARVLGLVADTATIAGSSLSDVGQIFNKVAASNRLSLEEVNQLSERGIPILAFLAKQYGVNAVAIREMVSEGKIGFKEFSAALETNLAGAALKSGNTTRGAFANAQAAISRFGAALLSGVFPQIKGFFTGFISLVDDLTPRAEAFGATIGAAFADFITPLGPALKEAQSLFTQFVAGFSGSVSSIEGPLSRAAALGAQVRTIFDQLVPVAGRFGAVLLSTGQQIISGLTPAFQALVPLIQSLAPVFGQVVGFVQSLIPAFGAVATAIGTFIAQVVPVIQPFIDQLVGALGPGLRSIAGIITGQLVPAFAAFLAAITPVVKFIITIVGPAIVGAFKGIIQAVQGALTIVSGLLNFFAALFTGNWSKLWESVKQIAAGAWQLIQGAFKVFINVGMVKIFSLGGKLILAVGRRLFSGLGTLFVKGLAQLAFATTRGLQAVVRLFAGLPGRAVRALSRLGSLLNRLFFRAFQAVNRAVTQGIRSLLRLVRSIPGRIRSGLGNVGRLLYQSGRNIISGLINGIRSRIGALVSQIRSAAARIRNALPFSPAKEGPLKGVRFERVGAGIIDDLRRGLASERSGLDADVRGLAGSLALPEQRTGPLGLSQTFGGPAGQGAPVVVNVTFSGPVGSQYELRNWLARSIDDLNRQGRLSGISAS